MKRAFLVLSFLGLTLFSVAQEYVEPWKPGYLDIHSIATGLGEAAVMIMPDGTTMMMDAGDTFGSRFISRALPDSSRTAGEWMAKYIKDFTAPTGHPSTVDYFFLTHLHSDHFGCIQAMKPGPHYGLAGVTRVGEDIHFGKIVDRGYPSYDFPSAERVEKLAGKSLPHYIKFVEYQRDSCGTVPERFEIGSRKQFRMVRDPKAYDFEIRNIACNGSVWTGKGLKSRTMYGSDPSKFDENCFSGVILVRYGNFKYYHGGDLSGGDSKGPQTGRRDFESQVAPLVGRVNAMKADHHGWKEVMNPYFLWILRPDAIVFSCSHINHPWKDTVQRLNDPLLPGKKLLFPTSDSGRKQVGEELWKTMQPWGHILIRVYEGGEKWEVFVLDPETGDYRIKHRTGLMTSAE